MNRSELLPARMLRLAIVMILPAFVLSACCTGKNFCFDTPGSGDCPAGYIYINDGKLDELRFARQGRAGVVDRSGRGGVKDRDGKPVVRFCTRSACSSQENCLDKTVPAGVNVSESNRIGFLVGELECVKVCDGPSQTDCNPEKVFDPDAVVGGSTPFCMNAGGIERADQ